MTRYGLSLPNRGILFGLEVSDLLRGAELADRSEVFGSVWVGDNFLSKPRLEAVTLLSALAARTERVVLGTVCLASFSMRHPLPLALEWASLDRISNGRTFLVVCAGGPASSGPLFAQELAFAGIKSTDRVKRMVEGIEVLRALWSKERATYHGEFFDFEDVELLPKPAQDRVPIAIAVNPRNDAAADVEERAMRRVARYGDGWQTDGTPPHVFERRWEMVRAFAEEFRRGEQVTHSSLHLMANINQSPSAARDEAVQFLDKYYGAGQISPEKLDDWLAFGPPEAVAEKISLFLDAGVTEPIIRFTARDQLRQITQFIEEVRPLLPAAP